MNNFILLSEKVNTPMIAYPRCQTGLSHASETSSNQQIQEYINVHVLMFKVSTLTKVLSIDSKCHWGWDYELEWLLLLRDYEFWLWFVLSWLNFGKIACLLSKLQSTTNIIWLKEFVTLSKIVVNCQAQYQLTRMNGGQEAVIMITIEGHDGVSWCTNCITHLKRLSIQMS